MYKFELNASRLILISTLWLASSSIVVSQRLTGISGSNCIDSVYTGVQNFWCNQGQCNVDVCNQIYQNWLYTDLVTACGYQWPNDDVQSYSMSKCSGKTSTSTTITPTITHKNGALRQSIHPFTSVVVGAMALSLAIALLSSTYLVMR